MPTINDVARQAEVSPATVSRVIRSEPNVHPATRQRVLEAIRRLGYVPSAIAQSMRSKRTRSLALVVSDITNPFWTTIARGVEDVAQRHDYSVLLCNTDENLAKQQRYLDLLISQQVDGVIIAPFDSAPAHLDKLRQRNIPTVILDRRIDGWEVDSVTSDSVAGGRALVQHLIRLGHTRIAMISGPATASTAEDRVAGYCLALAEAAIPLDRRLIRRGEYRIESGEALTAQIFDEGLAPTAIFAANNALALGALDALEARGLRVPSDVALVCFDDLPSVSHIFPFLTVVTQPVYDMGVNAAQLILSRLDSDVSLQPRRVVLPVRLIVRHSCGSQLGPDGECPLGLPLPKNGLAPSVMVRPITPEEARSLAPSLAVAAPRAAGSLGRRDGFDKPDVERLLAALRQEEPDRVPHMELQSAPQGVYEYVLEREVPYDASAVCAGGQALSPEDHVDYALRLGVDAVCCRFLWQPANGSAEAMEPPPSLAGQISMLERYIRAARGTGVGVAASFSSFLGRALSASGVTDASLSSDCERALVERWMDLLLENQEQVVRMVCNRFAADLALVVIDDPIADERGLRLAPGLFDTFFVPRMQCLIAPALDHGKPLLLQSTGQFQPALPSLYRLGFRAVHPIDWALDGLLAFRQDWTGKLALGGGVPARLLAEGSLTEIHDRVRECCTRLAPGGGYLLASSGCVADDVPPERFVAMARAVHKYGHSRSLGEDSNR